MSETPHPPEIVLAAHADLDRVKALLAEDPGSLNVIYAPWQESPLGAASHVGNRPIAEFLLEQGAPMTITTAAMLGRTETVREFLDRDPDLANATGAHGISLLFHAALSGKVEIAEMLLAYGGSTRAGGHALHAAVSGGHFEMTAWLLQHGAEPNAPNFRGETPLTVARSRGDDRISALLRQSGGRAE